MHRFSFPISRLYAITDLSLSGHLTHVSLVGHLLEGGCRWIQLREKHLSDDLYFEQIRKCVRLCRRANATLIVNDRVDLALAAGAHGVHLGQEDLDPRIAREILGNRAILGRSTHTADQAREAEADDAVDYVALGPVFSTKTKDTRYTPLGLKGVRQVRQWVRKPLVAIGGIRIEEAGSVLHAGCDAVAMISAIMAAPSITDRAKAINALLAHSI